MNAPSVNVDITPPVTSAALFPQPNTSGWNNSIVTVTLTSVDNPGGVGLKQILWSLNGAQTASTIVPGSTATVTISNEGITTLTYFATDNARNQEAAKTLVFQIDLTPPVMTLTGVSNGAVYFYNHVPTPECNTTDVLSGVATPASLTVTGGTKFHYGNYRATCSGAMDKAGNTTAPITVSYTVNGPTSLAGLVITKTGPINARVWRIVIGNSGPGTAFSAEITNLSLRQATGTSCTPHIASTLPVTAGNIGPFNSTTLSVMIDFSRCASNARFKLNGQVSANDGTAVGPVVMLDELP
jgi:hypothetical protein